MPIRALKSVVLSGLRMAGYELVKAQPYSSPAPFPEPVAPPDTIQVTNPVPIPPIPDKELYISLYDRGPSFVLQAELLLGSAGGDAPNIA
jgi:hypothetical protein